MRFLDRSLLEPRVKNGYQHKEGKKKKYQIVFLQKNHYQIIDLWFNFKYINYFNLIISI